MRFRHLLVFLCFLLAGCGSSVEQQILNDPVVNASLVSLQLVGPAQLAPGQTGQYVLSGTFSDGNTYDLSSQAAWSSSQTGLATIDAGGLATALTPGDTTITGSVNGRSASKILTVLAPNQATLTTIAVTPANATVRVGENLSFQAQGTFSDGSRRDLTGQVIWASSTPSIASISPLGQVRGLLEGGTTVSARLGAISGSTGLQVTPVPLTSLAISPLDARVLVGEGLTYSATATFADGTTTNATSQVAWSVSNPAIARISQGGAAVGVAPGIVNVTATLGGVSATSTLIVDALPFFFGGGGPVVPPAGTGRLHVSANNGDSIRSIAGASTATSPVTALASINDTPSDFGGITMDVTANILYAVDAAANRILSYNSPGASATLRNSVTGFERPGGGTSGFTNARDVAVGTIGAVSRLFLVCEVSETGQVHVVDNAGTANGVVSATDIRSHGNISFLEGTCSPRAVTYDQANDRLFIAVVGSRGGVVVVDNISTRPSGNLTGADVRIFHPVFGSDLPIRDPRGMMIAPDGKRLYIADRETGVLVYDDADVREGDINDEDVAASIKGKFAPNDVFIDGSSRDELYVTDDGGRIFTYRGASMLAGDIDAETAAFRILNAAVVGDPPLDTPNAIFIDFTRN